MARMLKNIRFLHVFLRLSGWGRRAEGKVRECTKSVCPTVSELIWRTRVQLAGSSEGKTCSNFSIILEPLGLIWEPFWAHFGVVWG